MQFPNDKVDLIRSLVEKIEAQERSVVASRAAFLTHQKETEDEAYRRSWWPRNPNLSFEDLVARFKEFDPEDTVIRAMARQAAELLEKHRAGLDSKRQLTERLLALVTEVGSARDVELDAAYDRILSRATAAFRPFANDDNGAQSLARVTPVCQALHQRIGEWRRGQTEVSKASRLLQELSTPIPQEATS
jgi:hypothetical protein